MTNAVTIEAGNKRLLRLADILDKADDLHKKRGEPAYLQVELVHDCGTPACALGHWAAHNPSKFTIRQFYSLSGYTIDRVDGQALFPGTYADFALTKKQGDSIFEINGCKRAKTAKQAAAFIRKFVKGRSS